MIRVVLGAYALARRSGFLNTVLGEYTLDHAYFAYKRYVEDPFHGLTRRHPELFHGGDILDVGANLGYTASVFARALSEGFQVYAFEPEQKNWEGLHRTVRRLGLGGRIRPIRAAAGSRTGTVPFWSNPASHADSRVAIEETSSAGSVRAGIEDVAMITLDSFMRERAGDAPVRFVKIDVQGYELQVLEGARSLLESTGITIATEVSRADPGEAGSVSNGVIDFLSERSFLPHTIDHHGRLAPADRTRIEQLSAKRGYIDVIWSRRPIA